MTMTTTGTTFKIFAPLLKTSVGPDGKKRFHGIASSTIKDRHGDTISLTALNEMEKTAQQSMTIFLNHSYNVPEDVAGSVEFAAIRSSLQDPDIHDLALDIVVNESNERAVKTWEAINGGTKLGLSIGAMIPEGGATRDRKSGAYQIDHVELLETSLVGVPANPRSWVEYAVKSLEKGSNLDELFDYEGDKEPQPNPVDDTIGGGDQARIDADRAAGVPTGTGEQPKEQLGKSQEPEETPANPEGDARVAAEDEARIDADEAAGIETDAATTGEENPQNKWTLELNRDYVDATTFGSTNSTYLVSTKPTTTNTSKATVSINTPYADINIDTGNRGKPTGDGSSQEAPESAPETEDEEATALANPWAAIGLGESEADLTAALQMLEPTVLSSLTTSSQLLEAITRELVETKAALTGVTEERDEAISMAEKAIKGTAEILANLSATPVGRRAVFREQSDKLASVSEVYGEDVLTLLKKG